VQAGKLDVNAVSREGYTPLMIAALSGRPAAVRSLLAAGAQLSQRSHRGSLAIAFASQAAGASNRECLQLLLDHPSCSPALVRHKGFRQRSALVVAVLCHGDGAVVRSLLRAGADPAETASTANITLLHSCAHLARWVLGPSGGRVGVQCLLAGALLLSPIHILPQHAPHMDT